MKKLNSYDQKDLVADKHKNFKETVYSYYEIHGRHDLPWRKSVTPYRVFISEVMLQQTQVSRVIPKFNQFITELPDFNSLAMVQTPKLLSLWQGLGYNRRALYLRDAAKVITTSYNNSIPRDTDLLVALPGIGQATAAAILNYSYNLPIPFIETNIRTVYIYHFFENKKDISDTALFPLVKETIDPVNPREWYWALMDYGSMLKVAVGNISKQSKHYMKQSRFAGSRRQVRGKILKILLKNDFTTLADLRKEIDHTDLELIIAELIQEKFISKDKNKLKII